jgi:peptidyl-prolyl cis-trans isomerase A (cyclophilin A)
LEEFWYSFTEDLFMVRIVKLFHKHAMAAVLLSAIAGGSYAQTAPATIAPAKPKTATPAKPATVTAPTYDRALLRPALLKDHAPESYQVKFETSRGDFTITVTRAWAPLGADRFYNLIKHHYFDNAHFFRVLPDFVAQFGISGFPAVTAAWEKAEIKDDPRSQSNKKGTITFATSGPNTRTTQLFINLADNTFLDSKGFTPFGTVDGTGMNVVEMLYDQYGSSAGDDQEAITKGGKKYIETKWPLLDIIRQATLVGAAAATPAVKPATAAKPSAAAKPQ